MNIRCAASAWLLAFALCGAAAAFDTIQTGKGKISGRIVEMDAAKIDVEQGAGGAMLQHVPVNEIQAVFYDAEPADLKTAKKRVLERRYPEAQAALERIKQEPNRPEIRQDIEFYKSLCDAKLALAGIRNVADAGRRMKAFADANPKNYHYFQAIETVGDLLLAVRQYAQAAEFYARLDGAPWPDYKMRAGVAAGRVLLEQGKARDALAAFDNVLANDAEGNLAEEQRIAARLGKAAALTALKRSDEALKIVDAILLKADPDDAPLMARAYDIQGTALRQAGRTKEAIVAFLHVDLLYASEPQAHAEALANLAELWEQEHKVERANRARQALEEKYKDSPWAKKAKR